MHFDFKLQKALLVGAGGKTGIWYSKLMLSHGIEVYAFDEKEVEYPEELISNQQFYRLSEVTSLKFYDAITLTPGVPLSKEIFVNAQSQGKVVFSELEYCSQFLDSKMIAITGTDGKSTTTYLLEQLLITNGKQALACGNFGVPISQVLVEGLSSAYTILVIELSSYQLELSRNFKPDVSLYLNVAPDHLNRYDSFEHYAKTKWNIAQNQVESNLCLYAKRLEQFHENGLKQTSFKKSSIDSENLESANYRIEGSKLVEKDSDTEINLAKTGLHGRHNYANLLFALEAIKHFEDITLKKVEQCLKSFTGLRHRFEVIENGDDQNLYINDSKASTTQALLSALKNVKAPLVLFLGGQGKGEDYSILLKSLEKSHAKIYFFGAIRDSMMKALIQIESQFAGAFETLDGAFKAAKKDQEGITSTYLLSPAATSWDQYPSFEERGEHFRRLVLES